MGYLAGGLFAGRKPMVIPNRSGIRSEARLITRSRHTGGRITIWATSLNATGSSSGPKLEGKIHIYCRRYGDNYYLNNAVYLVEDFLKTTTNPFYAGEVAYGSIAPSIVGTEIPPLPNAISRLRYHQMYVPKILDRIKRSAPGRCRCEELEILNRRQPNLECGDLAPL